MILFLLPPEHRVPSIAQQSVTALLPTLLQGAAHCCGVKRAVKGMLMA
jgi:hypothetical protein